MRVRTGIALLGAVSALLLSACRGREEVASVPATPTVEPLAEPRLPADRAGELIAKAIESSGGWKRWQRHRDVSFVSTLTIFDPVGNVTSETIFLHESPLHGGVRTRVQSIGLSEELLLGFDGHDTWMLFDGKAVSDPIRTAFTRFNAISNHYWFTLPFLLGEVPTAISYAGSENDGGRQWEKVRVDYGGVQNAPADWLVLYIDPSTGLVTKVLARVTAEFLRHSLWIAKLRDFRDCDGIKRERRRTFFPADEQGNIVGTMAAEQLVEHVRFDNGYPDSIWVRPLVAGGGSPAGG